MTKYYYIDEITKQQHGPFTYKELQQKNIHPEIMVWRSGMPDWAKAGTVEDLAFLFDRNIPMPGEIKENPVSNPYQPANSTPRQNTYNNQGTFRQSTLQSDERKWNDILPAPKNWLLESILLSIFCCSPVSVVGIFFASKVDSLYYAKDYEGANRASVKARNWALAGILFLPACYLIFFIFVAFIAAIF